ncbi:hypothetical protein L3070_09040 [Enterobacter cloacae complex sp. ECL405]|uniref:hypothetical protein n=1 Tax=Enterobacter cloacae complex TaxID=354276 RepID=UPI000F869B66|nr:MULTISPECIES: hypothetical protein [Enterobacter cloacae complex]UYT27973.1 hypothetical protein OKD05_19390 [Enterobacter cloacae]MCK6754968.1 hypothetical protein [Enterobacter asburiae]RTP82353.1 hypothetical protein EKN33_05225 [Enterobacter asburiae]UKB56321.1 hypothetical protein L3070_09040 [Enterobacter cloacae complex sp. ECL405]UYT37225.1 hypothetical protein OKD04_19375 [Enterobacter cloacae]
MIKLSTEQDNAVRDVARQCSTALKKAITDNPSAGWNSIATPILKEYHEKVKPMGVSGGDKARDNAVEWLKKQGVSL